MFRAAQGRFCDTLEAAARMRLTLTLAGLLTMSRISIGLFVLAITAGSAAATTSAPEPSPFRCALRETRAFFGELQTTSGFRWIECVVGVEAVDVEDVTINDGKCEALDWNAGRSFAMGQAINIPYACMSPIKVSITANGATFQMRLK
jgi:hypothetical protein